MTRQYRVYLLRQSFWKSLADDIDGNQDFNLKYDITIFERTNAPLNSFNYYIISLNEKIDKMIEEYDGAQLLPDNARDIDELKKYPEHFKCVYGLKDNTTYLRDF